MLQKFSPFCNQKLFIKHLEKQNSQGDIAENHQKYEKVPAKAFLVLQSLQKAKDLCFMKVARVPHF